MKVVVVATSYPRGPEDPSGRFVADAVDVARGAGIEVEVVSPSDVRHFGVAYGGGIVQNLRAKPWLAAAVPAFVGGLALATRRAARDADLVHAHWIPSALAARASGKPYVLQVWGTDIELARRAPALARPLVRGARVVVAASTALAEAARALGAREVRIVESAVAVPDEVGEPVDPAHVLFVGRLSPEKGIEDFMAATAAIPRAIAGDGPLRDLVPEPVGFVAPAEVGGWYDRASVVCVPSRREGYGLTAREAMAHGRAVVATRVGGLVDAIEDGVTGVLVPPNDPSALREAIVRLLADPALRERLGAAARASARARFSREVQERALLAVYAEALAG